MAWPGSGVECWSSHYPYPCLCGVLVITLSPTAWSRGCQAAQVVQSSGLGLSASEETNGMSESYFTLLGSRGS